MKKTILSTSALLAIVLASACSHDGSSASSTSRSSSSNLSDGQVVAVLLALNRGEVRQGQLAPDRAEAPDVRELASQMVQDHGRAAQELETWASENDVRTAESTVETRVERESEAVVDRLSDTAGPTFDRDYVDAQVQGHEQALELIDQVLVPTARDPELRAKLPVLRATVEGHLRHARSVQLRLQTQEPASAAAPPVPPTP